MDGTVVNPFMMGGSNPTGARAMLFLYSPRHYDDQVLRPHVYGFTDRTVGFLLEKGDTLEKAFNRPDVANSEEVANAIKPDSGGVTVGMDTYSQLWTFMLVITQPNNYNGVAMSAEGTRQTVLCGYCIGEPIAPQTMYMSSPVVNEDCQLVVQSRQILSANQRSYNASGAHNATTVMCADDIIDPSMNMAAKSRDLYVMTPHNVLANYDQSGNDVGSVISTPGVCMLSNLKERESVQGALKTPGVHMRQILQGLDMQIHESQAIDASPSGYGGIGVLSDACDVDQFKEGVSNKLNIGSYSGRVQTNGIDVMSIFTIHDVHMVYPDLIVQPQHIASMAQYRDPMTGMPLDVIPQTIMNPKVAYSSFCSSAISSIAADCGLSSISFMYTSYDPVKASDLDHSTFQVVRDNAYLTCPPQDQALYAFTLKGAVEMFRMLFQKNVAPFILGVVGNFEIAATYSINSETSVDLKLLDFGSNMNLSGGIYEAPNRLSGFMSTSLGSEEAFENNGHALNAFVLATQGRTQVNALGIPAFPGNNPSGMFDAPVTTGMGLPGFGF